MAKVAVILAGCGFLDGSEVHESVLTLLALAQRNHEVRCFAPDIPQRRVVNHLTGEEVEESRNVLVEAARIARGEISPLQELDVSQFDAIMLPGGFGAALNLSDYALKQENCSVDPDLRRVITQAHKAKLPIGATCITPAPLAKIFQDITPVVMTLGSSADSSKQLECMGMKAKSATVYEMIADEENKVYTTPCYMEPPNLAGMFEGICKVVDKLGS